MKNQHINTIWHKTLMQDVPYNLQNWLQHAGSFMARLQQFGVDNARIDVLAELWQCPDRDESQLLNMDLGTETLIREVLILSENRVWMFARTVIPQSFLTHKEQLAHLKTQPIGSILFNDKNITRGEFQFTRLHPTMDLYQKVQKYVPNADLLTRRSLFSLEQSALLLTEVFMPDLMTL